MLRSQEYNWYAIYTKSRFEKKLYSNLIKAGYEAFLPLIKEKRNWSDRIKTIEVPLLPCYLFLRAKELDFRNIYLMSGFVKFVSFDGKPAIIKKSEILLLNQIINNELPVTTRNLDCEIGDKVRVIRGPLRGWEGTIQSKKGNTSITFHFESIQQAISVEVYLDDVEFVSKRMASL